MVRVLRIINRFNLGGITYNVSYLSRYLPPEYETLLVGGPEEKTEESSLFIPQSLGLNPRLIPEMRRSLNPFSDLAAYLRIKKIIREFKPDIVHTHASKAGAIGRLAALSCGVPVIVHTFHGNVFSGYFNRPITSIVKAVERFLAARSTAIVAISNKQKEDLTVQHHICPASMIHVIPLGFDLRRFTEKQDEKRAIFRSRFKIDDQHLLIGIIGRLAPIKNHRLFIDAMARLSENKALRFKAVIVGDGETRRELEQYARDKQNGGDYIIFAGWEKQADLALAGFDLVCLSSVNEGTPVSLIEAQAAGKFIVSTNVGGISDILQPGCGLLSEVSDPEAFIANVQDAVTHFEKYRMQAQSARDSILEKFSYTRLCSDMDQLYKRLLK